MSTRQQIWLPSWVSDDVKVGLIAEGGCRCTAWCAYYNEGIGERPPIRNICPLYFRDRDSSFEASSQDSFVEFFDKPFDDPTRAINSYIIFEEDKISFEFGVGHPVANSLTYFREGFELNRSGQIILHYSTQPQEAWTQNSTSSELEQLEEYLRQIISPPNSP